MVEYGFARIFLLLWVLFLTRVSVVQAQFLSNLHATADSPLFTTYAAAKARSEFALDEGYHFTYYDTTKGVDFTTDTAGDWDLAFIRGADFVYRLDDLYRKPVITASYPDMVRYHYSPFKNLQVNGTFFVYSSHTALQDIILKNTGTESMSFRIIPFLRNRQHNFGQILFDSTNHAVFFSHTEQPDGWVLSHKSIPYVSHVRDIFAISAPANAHSIISIRDSSNITKNGFSAGTSEHDHAKIIAMPIRLTLDPGETQHIRIVRSVSRSDKSNEYLISEARKALHLDLRPFINADKKLYNHIPNLHFHNPDDALLYYSAFNLMDQVMLPPEGQLHVNYYVFSREPQWGWGHGGQVFHESMSMLAYALMNPQSAMNSQRVYLETQHKNGYINYRTGPYLNETIPTNGQLTSSAPLYAWENWKIYEMTRDKKFLRQMYASSRKFYHFFVTHRDKDGDGLCEWGGQAVLESLRDSQVAVWDQVGWPGDFEDLGLNCMLVKEAKSLANMAKALGKNSEAQQWRKKAQKRAALINKYMWDPQTGFYYNVNMKDNSFTYKKPNDLKRQEIIGFLPLWAGIATKKQASILIKTLTNPDEFWRKYGIPSLSADDPYYNPEGYWNGPVWVQWNYMIEDGLLKYGYDKLAKELVNKVSENMISQLKKNHTLWEFYSPDSEWGGHHQTYIWAGIINRMFFDLDRAGKHKNS